MYKYILFQSANETNILDIALFLVFLFTQLSKRINDDTHDNVGHDDHNEQVVDGITKESSRIVGCRRIRLCELPSDASRNLTVHVECVQKTIQHRVTLPLKGNVIDMIGLLENLLRPSSKRPACRCR